MRETEILRGLGKAKTKCYANGTPFVKGPGTGTSDSVPAHLSRGEAVLPAQTVRAVGPTNIARLIHSTTGHAPHKGLRSGGHYVYGVVGDQDQFIKDTVLDKPNTMPMKRTPTNIVMDPAVQSAAPELIKPSVSPETAHGRAALGGAQPAPAVEPVAPRPLLNPANTAGTAFARKQGIPDPVMPESVTPEVKPNLGAPESVTPEVKPNLGAPELEGTSPASEPVAPKTYGQRFKDAKNAFSGRPVTPGVAPAAGAADAASAGSWAGRATKSVLRGAGKLAVPLTVGMGAYDYAHTTKDQNKAFANSVGADYDTFGGRIGAGTADLLKHIGDTATFGMATKTGNGLAAVLNGGKFFEGWDKDTAPVAPVAAKPVAPAPSQTQTGVITAEQTAPNNLASARNVPDAVRDATPTSQLINNKGGFVTTNLSNGQHTTSYVGGTEPQGNQASMDPREAYRANLLDKAQNSHLKSESAAAMAALANMDSTDSANYGHDVQALNNKQTIAYNSGVANNERIQKQITALAGVDETGKVNAVKYGDIQRKIMGTFGKYNIPLNSVSPEEFNHFINLYERGVADADPGLLQKLDDFVSQRRRTTSNDVLNNAAVASDPNAFANSIIDRKNNHTPTNLRAGGSWWGNNKNIDSMQMDDESMAAATQQQKLRAQKGY